MRRVVAGLGFAVLAIVACGGGDDDSVATADVERSCQLMQRLDAFEFGMDFAGASPDPDAVLSALSDFVDARGEELEALERVAPPEIADVVKSLNASIREFVRTGDLAALRAAGEPEEIQQRLQDFEERECS